MTFLQYLLCNQYADISKRGGNVRKAHINTLLLTTVLITLLIITAFVFFDQFHPGFLNKYLGGLGIREKDIGRLLAAVVGVIIFFLLKLTIGKKSWYDNTIEEFKRSKKNQPQRNTIFLYCIVACYSFYAGCNFFCL
jgi:amino acid transporter